MGSLIWFSQILCLSFILLQFRVQSSSPSQSSLDSPPHLCSPEERSALLDFKSTTDMMDGYICTPRPIIQTWNERKDCCLWEGITCDKRKGHVIGLDLGSNCLEANLTTNSSLFRLEKLQSLNLADNHFSYPNLSFGFDRWKSLSYLDLSDSINIDGSLPLDEIFLLPKLVSLDLSYNHGLLFDNIKFQMLVHNLTELRFLILDFANMSLVVPSSLLNLTSSLEHLSLRSCIWQGNFPSQVFQLTKLVSLDFSQNDDLLLDNIKFQMLVHNLTKLRFLILDFVNMSLVMPSSLLNLTSSLEHLKLSSCNLQGNFPSQVFQLPSLQLLDLSDNSHLGGNLPQSSLSSALEYLNLDGCQFYGSIPDVFGKMHKLTHLNLFNNNFDGEIPTSIFNLTSLTYLRLSSNKLRGPLPCNISGLSFLHEFRMDNNFIIGRVPSWLFSLPSLSYLVLKNNKLTGPIDNVEIPNLILEEIYLSNNEISGSIPSSFFHLVNLTTVDLSSNNLSGTITANMLSKLVNLQKLDLSDNSLLSLSNNDTAVNYSFPNLRSLKFSSCNIHKFPSFLRKAKSLQELDISKNKISGQIHKWEIEGMSLDTLDLSYNSLTGIDSFGFGFLETVDLRSNLLEGSLPVLSTTWDSMQQLFISGNNLNGEIPPSYCNLTSLGVVDLANNSLGGKIPECLGNLSNLAFLDLQMNKFHGRIPISFVNKSELRTLNLNGNQLEGILPRSLVSCTNLKVLDVGNNNLNDTFPAWLGVLPSLIVLILRSNQFHGAVSNSMPTFYFSELGIIDVSQNDFMGLLPCNFFKNLKAMRHVPLADEAKQEFIGDFYYKDFVKAIKKVSESVLVSRLEIFTTIDFSSNQFHGSIPEELGELNSLSLLSLSHNSLTGQIPSFLGKMTELNLLDLSSNKLEGKISERLTNLTGEIPSYCNLTSLRVLVLANNSLEGKIPECLGNLSDLSILDLGMNKFHGRIPNSFVNNSFLRTLELNSNQLEGRLPSSLVNCRQLELLDVGNNYLDDNFPHWLGVLPRLRVLILRSNRFHGPISNSMTAISFSQLRVVDISHNYFVGLLPSNYFKTLKGMRDVPQADKVKLEYIGDFYYKDSVKVVMKGLEVKLVRILKIFTTIDFSSNQFHGPIPKELGGLNSLLLLNFSHNSLTGQIQPSLGKMTELESLDLSSNKFEGRIPEQLTSLTFLSILNLSHNKLEGEIPQGKQFNTFSNDSYIGNSGLCGLPLTKKCHNEEEPGAPLSKFDEEDDSVALFNWRFALAGYGCGLVLGLSLGYIAFATGKPWWVVKKVEKYQQKFVGRWNLRHKKIKTQNSNQRS